MCEEGKNVDKSSPNGPASQSTRTARSDNSGLLYLEISKCLSGPRWMFLALAHTFFMSMMLFFLVVIGRNS